MRAGVQVCGRASVRASIVSFFGYTSSLKLCFIRIFNLLHCIYMLVFVCIYSSKHSMGEIISFIKCY